MLRTFAYVGALALVASVSRPAAALTDPIAGAVPFPSNVTLLLPFPAGHEIRVSAGYSPSGGSSLHADTDRTDKANEYYALDLVYENEADNGLGMPVVAPIGGEVVLSGWSTEGWENYGLRVVLRHDFGDGHIYHSTYAHLNAIDGAVAVGATVTQGQVLGELGRSCQGALSCSSFSGAHLHWSIHRDSTIGGSGTFGSYGGNAVVPEPLDGAEDIVPGMIITSTNSGQVVCGDGVCSGDENHQSCAEDCPVCTMIPPEGGIVDESERPCFTAGGNQSYWHDEAAGYGDTLKWTLTTDDAQVDNYGVWRLRFALAGDYLLEIYTDAAFAQSEQASYRVTHATGEETLVLDQTAVDGWSELGMFSFAADVDQQVRLDDNTGEPLSESKQLVFDAIRLTGPGSGGTGGGGGGATGGTGATGGSAGGEDPSGADGVAASDDGCGCGLVGRPSAASPLACGFPFVLLLWIRRRWRAVGQSQ